MSEYCKIVPQCTSITNICANPSEQSFQISAVDKEQSKSHANDLIQSPLRAKNNGLAPPKLLCLQNQVRMPGFFVVSMNNLT